MTYYIIFGTIFSSLIKNIFLLTDDSFFASNSLYILLLALFNLPICFKREIKELKILAYILFISCAIFVSSFICLSIFEGLIHNPMPSD